MISDIIEAAAPTRAPEAATVYVAAQTTRLLVSDIASALGCTPKGVVNASKRARALRAEDEDFRRATDQLVAEFKGRQT